MMKTSLVLASLVLGRFAEAFVATSPLHATSSTSLLKGQASTELGLPCEDDCAIAKYPNLPASVHPGVLSGQAQLDLLRHAKENGELKNVGENAELQPPI
jgi:fructose-bisphosphate aldolase, class II